MSGPDCSQTLHRLYEYLDGEMTPEDTATIARHLAECAPCMEQHDIEAAVKALLKRSCRQEQAPVALRTAIVQRLTTLRIEYTD
ncbi:Anti-sigma factor (fragment) [Nostocoides japonicum T1-X7]|uniref:Anti-sigma factor n=1 Tax=Nostocoides japonicum T1-X7 TaxID=1194083 RepID=A0A077M1N7_9MICO